MDEVYGVCPYCGFDAEYAVAYQSKQNNETLSSAEHDEEVEFYLYESHPDFCEGMRNSLKESETFEAPYAGLSSLFKFGDNESALGGFTAKELTESSAIHGDFDSASLNYSGKQNLEVRQSEDLKSKAPATVHGKPVYGVLVNDDGIIKYMDGDFHKGEDGSRDYSIQASVDFLNRPGAKYEGTNVKFIRFDDGVIFSDMEYSWHDPTEEDFFAADYEPETFEAYNPEQPRDEGGRWISDTPISDEEMQSYITGAHFRRHSKHDNKITLRQLSETLVETTDNHLDFDTAYKLVNQMLAEHSQGDSEETRKALLFTLEETQMQLEYANEIGWDMDLEIMAGLLRSRGIQPPEEYEEAVINRLTFEDEWAAEETVGYDKPLGESLNWTPYEYRDSKNNKPNKPTPAKDFDMGDTFGSNVLLMAETFESSNYKCVSCGITFAQEDTRDIDGDIVCDDCVYEIYDIDGMDAESFSPKWEVGDYLTLDDIGELISAAQDRGCLVTSYNAREVLDSSDFSQIKDWQTASIIEIYTDYKYTDASKSRFNYEHKFVYDFERVASERFIERSQWRLDSLEQPYAISLAYPYHMQYIVQSSDPDEAADMAYRGDGKRSDVGDLSKTPIFAWPPSVGWEPNSDDARPLYE